MFIKQSTAHSAYTGVVGKLACEQIRLVTKEQIKDIAENLDSGFRCFIHRENRNIKFIPDFMRHPDMDTEPWDTDNQQIEKNYNDFIEILGMDSRDSFKLMSDFLDLVDDDIIRHRLDQSLSSAKPFRNFKFQVDTAGPFRVKWFQFKQTQLENWVARQLMENGL